MFCALEHGERSQYVLLYFFCPLSGYLHNIRSKVKRACEYVMTGKYLSRLKKKKTPLRI